MSVDEEKVDKVECYDSFMIQILDTCNIFNFTNTSE